MKTQYKKMFDLENSLKQDLEAKIANAAMNRIVIVLVVWGLLFALNQITQLHLLSTLSTFAICFLLGSYIFLEVLLVISQIKDLEFAEDPVENDTINVTTYEKM